MLGTRKASTQVVAGERSRLHQLRFIPSPPRRPGRFRIGNFRPT